MNIELTGLKAGEEITFTVNGKVIFTYRHKSIDELMECEDNLATTELNPYVVRRLAEVNVHTVSDFWKMFNQIGLAGFIRVPNIGSKAMRDLREYVESQIGDTIRADTLGSK